MKTVLVICEVKYWRDLRDGLASFGLGFLGFDKKTPSRSEIERLVGKADFVVIRNVNVAHHSVRFAKEACKLTGTPFWVGSNFGLEKIMERLHLAFPADVFVAAQPALKSKAVQRPQSGKKLAQARPHFPQKTPKLAAKRRNLALKEALKDVKVEEELDFTKLFKP